MFYNLVVLYQCKSPFVSDLGRRIFVHRFLRCGGVLSAPSGLVQGLMSQPAAPDRLQHAEHIGDVVMILS